jgi:hypothetical protein
MQVWSIFFHKQSHQFRQIRRVNIRLPNALVERLGGGMRTNFGIRITFKMPITQIRGVNPDKSDSNQMLGRFLLELFTLNHLL